MKIKTRDEATADARERASLTGWTYVVYQDLWSSPSGDFGCVSKDVWDKAGPFRTLVLREIVTP